MRFGERIKDAEYTAADRLKLKTLFGVRDISNTVRREPRGEEVVNIVRSVLAKIREEDTNIKGFLVFGSRMDPEKLSRDMATLEMTEDDPTGGMSDIDVITLVNPADAFTDMMDTYPTHWRMEEIKKELYPEVTARFGRSSILHYAELYDLISGKTVDFSFPDWGWNREAVRFVGRLVISDYFSNSGHEEIYEEDDVNRMIQEFLKSDKAEMAKKEILDKARMDLVS